MWKKWRLKKLRLSGKGDRNPKAKIVFHKFEQRKSMTVLRNEDSEKGRQRQQTLKKTERQRRLQWVRRKRRGKAVKVFGGKYDIWIVHSNFDNWGDNCITVKYVIEY